MTLDTHTKMLNRLKGHISYPNESYRRNYQAWIQSQISAQSQREWHQNVYYVMSKCNNGGTSLSPSKRATVCRCDLLC